MFIFGGSQVNSYSDGTLMEFQLVREGEEEETEEVTTLKGFRS